MRLDKKDIEAVAARRFWHEHHRAWKVAGMLLATLCLTIMLTRITESIISVLPVALGLASLIWISIKADRYIDNFVEEWKMSMVEKLADREGKR